MAVTAHAVHYVVETKGREEINVINKDRAAQLWCENASTLTGTPWAYLKVRQKEFTSLQPSSSLPALKELAKLLKGRDSLDRHVVREECVNRLTKAGVRTPLLMVDRALGRGRKRR